MSLQDGTIRKGIYKLSKLIFNSLIFMPTGDKIASCHTRKKYEVQEVGVMHPEELPTASLQPGQVGYIACNMKESSEGRWSCVLFWNCHKGGHLAHVGDTLYRVGTPVDPMPGFRPAKAMVSMRCFSQPNPHCLQVYAGIFPVDTNDFIKLEESVKRVRHRLWHFSNHFSTGACPANAY